MKIAENYRQWSADAKGRKLHLDFADIMRGIGILLVVLGHSIKPMSESLNTAILSFHMPLFFFISGMFVSANHTPAEFLKKKAFSILVPQLTVGVITIIESILFDVLLLHHLKWSEVNYVPFLTNWFLPTLFFMEMVMYLVLKLAKEKKWIVFSALIAAIILFIAVSYSKIQYIQQTLAALIFGFSGFLLKPVLIYLSQSKTTAYGGIGWLVFCVLCVGSKCNDPIGMYQNEYGNKIIFILVSFIGISAAYLISLMIKSDKLFTFLGQNSICIFVTHFIILRTMKGAVNQLSFVEKQVEAYPFYLITFLLTILIEIPCIILIGRYFPFLIGKKKPKVSK